MNHQATNKPTLLEMGGLRSGEKRKPKKSSSVGSAAAGDRPTKRAIPPAAPPPEIAARTRSASAGSSRWTSARKRRRPSSPCAAPAAAWAARTSGGGCASGDRSYVAVTVLLTYDNMITDFMERPLCTVLLITVRTCVATSLYISYPPATTLSVISRCDDSFVTVCFLCASYSHVNALNDNVQCFGVRLL